MRRCDSSGNVTPWQFGSSGKDEVRGMAVDGRGGVIVVGSTGSAVLERPSEGLFDAFIAWTESSKKFLLPAVTTDNATNIRQTTA